MNKSFPGIVSLIVAAIRYITLPLYCFCKPLKIFILIILLFSSLSFAQNFFPTELDNRYQMFENYEGHIPGAYHHYQIWDQVRIVKDTIIEGKYFIKFNETPLGDYYYHYNENENKLYVRTASNLTMIAIDFTAANGDTFFSYIDERFYMSLGIQPINFHGSTLPSFSCTSLQYYPFPLAEQIFKFAKDVGLYYAYIHYEFPAGEQITDELSGWNNKKSNPLYFSKNWFFARSAIVGTNVYGEISLQMDSLAPIQDRPVNLFPFTITGYYHTNINSGEYNAGEDLVSMFLDIIHMRDSDTLGIYRYNFDSINVYIPLTPQVGDKLFLRAVASDTSIFYNEDTYPDEGYIEMNVLPAVVNVNDYSSSADFFVRQNYPNPFNPLTTIQYNIPERAFVSLVIFDVMGNEIATLVNEVKQTGIYNQVFDGSGLASGLYFYKLSSGSKTEIKKMILIK